MNGNEVPIRGHIAGAPLGDADCLISPWRRDAFYRLRPALSARALRLSAELCDMTYHLTIDPWMAAGWTDISIQVDNSLHSGLTASMRGEQMLGFVNSWKRMRARSQLKEHNPVSQIMGALRQRESSDTVKAVTMIKKADCGRYVVSVGFMGTGSRFYDWISNLRFSPEEGFHKGFYQLASYFEKSSDKIVFPDTARELGLERLTLSDVISEMKSPDSRFFMWMAGHSQGGAVMQIFAHMLIHSWGVLPQNMVGYGFASPTVATGKLIFDPASYPLYHIINSDDYVPRMGALCHLGMGLCYQSNDVMRSAAYGLSDDDGDKAARDTFKRLYLRAVDTPTMMETTTALLRALLTCKGEETLEQLSDKRWSVAPIDRMLAAAGNKAQSLMENLTKYVESAYDDLTGRAMDEKLMKALTEQFIDAIQPMPFMQILRALGESVLPAHSINRDHGRVMGAYAYIAQRGLSAMQPFIWVCTKTAPPKKHTAEACIWEEPPLPSIPAATHPVRIARKLPPPILTLKVHGISAMRRGNRPVSRRG